MIENIKGFGDTEFQIKDTKFSITKLSPMKGFEVSEKIRVALAASSDKINVEDGSEEQSILLFFKSIMAMPIDFVDDIRKSLFLHIQYSGKKVGVESGWAALSGLEDSAFKNFETINIYEVFGRALFVL